MIARTISCAVRGLGGVVVNVEADLANGLPAFTIVGLTDRAIQEARERVKAAIRNAGFDFPQRKLTVNLAPPILSESRYYPGYVLPGQRRLRSDLRGPTRRGRRGSPARGLSGPLCPARMGRRR